MFKMSPFLFAVCAEAYNPDEEEDDAESRVRSWLDWVMSNALCKENNSGHADFQDNEVTYFLSSPYLESLLLLQILQKYFYLPPPPRPTLHIVSLG